MNAVLLLYLHAVTGRHLPRFELTDNEGVESSPCVSIYTNERSEIRRWPASFLLTRNGFFHWDRPLLWLALHHPVPD
jgi:hypothetical protein